ncbi:hypothetical protein BHE74_00058329, partial [Ensete ventricosum]
RKRKRTSIEESVNILGGNGQLKLEILVRVYESGSVNLVHLKKLQELMMQKPVGSVARKPRRTSLVRHQFLESAFVRLTAAEAPNSNPKDTFNSNHSFTYLNDTNQDFHPDIDFVR